MTKPRRPIATSASVQARHEVDQAFRVGGKVVERKVEVGQAVREGDVLAVLDDDRLPAGRGSGAPAAGRRRRAGAPGRIGSPTAHRPEGRRLGQRIRRRARAKQCADHAGGGRGPGQAARARPQPLEVHGAARIAQRRGHVQKVRGGAGRGRRPAGGLDRRRGRARDRRRRARGSARRVQEGAASRHRCASAPDETFEVVLRELSPQAAQQTRTYRARLKPSEPAAACRSARPPR